MHALDSSCRVFVMPDALLNRADHFPMALNVQPYTYQASNNSTKAYVQKHGGWFSEASSLGIKTMHVNNPQTST